MEKHTTHSEYNGDLLARLNTLEAELERIRDAVGAVDDDALHLPDETFHALRMNLGDDTYGVPIGWVREIVRYVELTRIADVPSFVAGTINYRGEILPVIDGRLRFALPAQKPRRGTAIVLLRAAHVEAGIIVDAVRDVAEIAAGTLQAPSGPLASAKAVAALTTVDSEVVQLLDLGRILSRQQWETVRQATSNVPPGPSDGASDLPSEDEW